MSKLYLYLRKNLYKKRPPKTYDEVLLSSDDTSPVISKIVDNHGYRIRMGSFPITVLDSRETIDGKAMRQKTELIDHCVSLVIGDEELTTRFHKKDSWSMLSIDHSFVHAFGLAEKHGGLNKIGESWEIWNTDAANMEPEDDPLYKSYPILVLGKPGSWIALIVDYPGYQRWDLTREKEIAIHIQSTEFTFDVITASGPKQLMSKVGQVLGAMDLPPLWSLGYHQCRWSYFPADRVQEIADGFRTRDIPIDALYLDIDYMDEFRIFTWDKDNFGDLPQLVQDLHAKDFKVITMIDPGIKHDPGYFVFDQGRELDMFVKHNGSVYTAPVWPGKSVFPDFFNPRVRTWWGGLYQPFVELGVDGFWNDMNEPATFTLRGTMHDRALHWLDDGTTVEHQQVHNLYGQKMVQASYEGLQKLQPSKRIFLLSRAAYIGSQNYGWIWSGDNRSAWSHLEMSIHKIMGTGLSGHFANGPDIGGFRETATPELYARWIQLGVFYPFMRTHTIKFDGDQEPWSFGDEVEQIAREMIRLRYRLLPYIYTYFREGCVTGIPLMRPMFMEFPEDLRCYEDEIMNYQFMFGPDLLIAPVVREGEREKEVYLPAGTWHQFDSNDLYEGGQVITIDAPLDRINIFVRDNRIIPVYKKVGVNVEETVASGLDFVVYGDEATGLVYLDDGKSLDYQEGTFGLYHIDMQLSLTLKEGEGYR